MYCIVLTTYEKLSLKLEDLPVSASKCKKILGIEIHHEVPIDPHVETLWKKTIKKLHAVWQVALLLRSELKRTLTLFLILSFFVCISYVDVPFYITK